MNNSDIDEEGVKNATYFILTRPVQAHRLSSFLSRFG